MSVKPVELQPRVTKVCVLTQDKVAFGDFLKSRRIQLEADPSTESWQGVESNITTFALSLYPVVGDEVYRQWCDLQGPGKGYPILS